MLVRRLPSGSTHHVFIASCAVIAKQAVIGRPRTRAEVRQLGIDRRQIAHLGIEVSAAPADQVLVLGMRRIGDGHQEVAIASDATDVFRRTGPRAVDTAWVGDAGFRGHPAQLGGSGSIDGPLPFWVRLTVGDAANLELVEMRLRPAEGDLQHVVQAAQVDGTGRLQSAPDGRLRLQERYLPTPVKARSALSSALTELHPVLSVSLLGRKADHASRLLQPGARTRRRERP